MSKLKIEDVIEAASKLVIKRVKTFHTAGYIFGIYFDTEDTSEKMRKTIDRIITLLEKEIA